MKVSLPPQLQGLSAEEEQLILALSTQARLQYAVSTPPVIPLLFLVNVLAQEFQILEQLLATRRERRTYDRAGSFDICR